MKKKYQLFTLFLILSALMFSALACKDKTPANPFEDQEEDLADYDKPLSEETQKYLEDLKASGVPFIYQNADGEIRYEDEDTNTNQVVYVTPTPNSIMQSEFYKGWPNNKWTSLVPTPSFEEVISTSITDELETEEVCVIAFRISKENALAYKTALVNADFDINAEEVNELLDADVYTYSATGIDANEVVFNYINGIGYLQITLGNLGNEIK